MRREKEKNIRENVNKIKKEQQNTFLSYEDIQKEYLNFKKVKKGSLIDLTFMFSCLNSETKEHSLRVSKLMMELAKKLNRKGYNFSLTKCALLGKYHDIGKLCIPNNVLEKKGRLSIEERDIVDNHSIFSYYILKWCNLPFDICKIIGLHHENEKTNNLRKTLVITEEDETYITLLKVCDMYDALSSNRCYKEKFSDKRTKEIILSNFKESKKLDREEAFLVLAFL